MPKKAKQKWGKIDVSAEEESNRKASHEAVRVNLSDVSNSDLFFIDKGLPSRRDQIRTKMLRSEKVLAPTTTVKPVKAVKETKYLPKNRNPSAPAKPKADDSAKDIWGDAISTATTPSFVQPGTDKAHYEPRKTKIVPKPPKKYVPSTAPALPTPAAGASVNPSFDAHQDLLAHAVACEVEKLEAREMVDTRIRVDPRNLDNFAHLLSNEAAEESESDEDETALVANDNDGTTATAAATKKAATKLTKTQRNRQARQKEAEKIRLAKLEKKRLRSELNDLPKIAKEVAELEQAREEERLRRKRGREEREAQVPKKLGRHKYTPKDPEVRLTEELAPTLRATKVENSYSLLEDRFKWAQRRNMIAPSIRVGRKGPKWKSKLIEKK